MLFKILEPFKYSPDGLAVVELTADSEPMSIREDLQEGLLEARLIAPADAAPAKTGRQARAAA